MGRGKSVARRIYVADFETTTDPDDCRVWNWGLIDLDTATDFEWGIDVASFVERVSEENSTVYFHNMKFDDAFLFDYLLKNRYRHTQDDKHGLARGEFSTLISDMGQHYTFKVRWFNGNETEFRDSLKKIPMGVEAIAKTFKLDHAKQEMDYHKDRPAGYQPTSEELFYLECDLVIVAKALKEFYDNGAKRLTTGSDSLAQYKAMTGKRFRKYFPLLSEDMDLELRRAYRGGFTYLNPKFKGKMLGKGMVFDVNSLYPSVMVNEFLPWGEPVFFEGEPEVDESHPLMIFAVTFTATLKDNHIPCIQIKGNSRFGETEYLTQILDPVTLYVTNIDWALYNDHYDIDVIDFEGGWKFKQQRGLFDDFIHMHNEIKMTEKGGKRELSKLRMNSLYGKFATNPIVSSKVPYLKDGVVKMRRTADDHREPVYTPLGVFITSYARNITVRAAQDNYDVFIYADTDSLFLLTTDIPDNLDIDEVKLGYWDHELDFGSAYFMRAKAYLVQKLDGSYKNAIAGLPTNISQNLTFSDIVNGRVIHGKLTQKIVSGGAVLIDIPYKLKF